MATGLPSTPPPGTDADPPVLLPPEFVPLDEQQQREVVALLAEILTVFLEKRQPKS